MIPRITAVCQLLFLLCLSPLARAQRDYQNYEQLTARLKKMSLQYSRLCTVTSIGKTATGKEIWLITLGRENAANKPAILIAAGVQATQLATTEVAVQMAEQMLVSAILHDSTDHLLRTKTFYILPNLNPDASEQYHEQVRWERTGNAQPRDDDRDGRIFEDPYEDLNNDGLITMLRVEDTLGTHRVSAFDKRVMTQVNKSKGEKGTHFLITEGLDNDKDGLFNEDAEGGVNFNKNFTFNYQAFQRETGEHALSERETKAFADFMLSARNVHSVFVFGPATTLLQAQTAVKPEVNNKAVLQAAAQDDSTRRQVINLYEKVVPTENAPIIAPEGGDVVQWAHLHNGRFSYSTPAWWVPQLSTLPQGTTTEQERNDISFLEWAAAHNMTGIFLPWTAIQHPDFPDKKVELGGFAPYAQNTPPVHLLGPVAKNHLRFMTLYSNQMPKLQILNLKADRTKDGNTRISAEVQNTGQLPTHASIGDYLPWIQKIKVAVKLEEGQQLLQGKPVHTFNALGGGEKVKVSWEVSGSGYVIIEAKSPTAGSQSKQLALKQ
ncbi:peptidase M14 [Nibribacter ruber]|uniref:Peptidase M14 n=1 Tax=Nibribacter ruber TaxID=2698458 RepID=A0A6P1NTL1_9BACT|nr:M14 family metallopeptidase [Nibribacter ruber]QHL86380.1 peptidase M14 [Nibribacter ruber]